MKDLVNLVGKYAVYWKEIGIELGIEFHLIHIIEADYPKQSFDCLLEILHQWLDITLNATWRSLEVALTNVSRRHLGLGPVDNLYDSQSYMHGQGGCKCECGLASTAYYAHVSAYK